MLCGLLLVCSPCRHVKLAPQFALWVKQKIVSGQPVIVAMRIKGGSYQDYDHIM